MMQRLVRDLERGVVLELVRPKSRARVTSITAAPEGEPAGSVVVNFRYLDGERVGQVDGVVLQPLQRVRLSDGD
jgi:hypothetical protein